jgi:hypothetical protein
MYVLPKFSRMTGWQQQPRSVGWTDGCHGPKSMVEWMNSQKRTLEVAKLDDQDLFGKTTFRMKIII